MKFIDLFTPIRANCATTAKSSHTLLCLKVTPPFQNCFGGNLPNCSVIAPFSFFSEEFHPRRPWLLIASVEKSTVGSKPICWPQSEGQHEDSSINMELVISVFARNQQLVCHVFVVVCYIEANRFMVCFSSKSGRLKVDC